MTWRIRQVGNSDELLAFLGTLSGLATSQAKIINLVIGYKIVYPEIPVATGGAVTGSMSIPSVGVFNIYGNKLP